MTSIIIKYRLKKKKWEILKTKTANILQKFREN